MVLKFSYYNYYTFIVFRKKKRKNKKLLEYKYNHNICIYVIFEALSIRIHTMLLHHNPTYYILQWWSWWIYFCTLVSWENHRPGNTNTDLHERRLLWQLHKCTDEQLAFVKPFICSHGSSILQFVMSSNLLRMGYHPNGGHQWSLLTDFGVRAVV